MGLYRYNLGVDPKEEAEEKNLVSPFMKLEMDEPKKVHVELDLDEGNLSRGIVNCSVMVIIEWFGISEFSRTFFNICGSLGDFCLGLPIEGKLINVHYFSGILDF